LLSQQREKFFDKYYPSIAKRFFCIVKSMGFSF
jgi:hypothetical protein